MNMKNKLRQRRPRRRPNTYAAALLLLLLAGAALYAYLQLSDNGQLHPRPKAEVIVQANRQANRADSIVRRQEYLALTLWAHHASQTAAQRPQDFIAALNPPTRPDRPHQPDTQCVTTHWAALQKAPPDQEAQVKQVIDRIYACVDRARADPGQPPPDGNPTHLFDLRLTTLWRSLNPEGFINAKLTLQGAEVNRENSPTFRTFAEAYSHCPTQVRRQTLATLPEIPNARQLAQAWNRAEIAYETCLSQTHHQLFPLPEPTAPPAP